jgi:hypothetical protein
LFEENKVKAARRLKNNYENITSKSIFFKPEILLECIVIKLAEITKTNLYSGWLSGGCIRHVVLQSSVHAMASINSSDNKARTDNERQIGKNLIPNNSPINEPPFNSSSALIEA